MTATVGGQRVGIVHGDPESLVGWRLALEAQVSVTFTHPVGDGLHSAIIKAAKPIDTDMATTAAAPAGRTALPLLSDSGCC